MQGSTIRIIAWVTLIVAAELTAFWLLQKSLDRPKKVAYIAAAVALFGIVVPLAFRQTLREGSDIAVSNLYWIILSQAGSVALGAVAFKQTLSAREWAATALLAASATAAFALPSKK